MTRPPELAASPKVALIFDVEQRRPACVLIQAVAGCPGDLVSQLFNDESWLVAPTPGMRRIEGTREEWGRLAVAVNAEYPMRPLGGKVAR